MSNVLDSEVPWLTPQWILRALKSVDGDGSGLDADTLDGLRSDAFAVLAVPNTFAGKITITGSAEGVKIVGVGTTGDPSIGYIGFYDSDGSTRRGFIGDGSAANDDLYLKADTGDLRLGDSSGSGVVVLSGGMVSLAGNFAVNGATPPAKPTVT